MLMVWVLHIESTIAHVDQEELHKNKYDEAFIKRNIRFYRADSIPHFNEKTPDGVFNAEYDCDLESIQGLQIDELKRWILEAQSV